MRIIPLGGAHEVGASSTIVEFGPHRVLVDAGIRIGSNSGEQLPDLSQIQREAGRLEAIFLTHAHMDHSGALPLVHMAFPDVPIFMTPATASVVRILLSDSLNLMGSRFEQEGEIPLYPPEAVESCLGIIRPVPFDFPIRIAGGDIAVTFHPAGHILGASSILLEGTSGSVLLSGDISVTDQRTVPGMLPPAIQPDVIMVESTYGDRLHAHRPTQETNLVHTVKESIASGGKVIIPAFAVGRAQEIILILRQAIANKELPPVPIFVDGMVQSVCDAYSRFPSYLQRHLRLSLQKGENPFFPAGGNVHRVRNANQRMKVLEGPPCCIIASSGMMTGGPSAFYATHLAGQSNNLIAITGYQDEEAPGRRLLDLAEAAPEKRSLRILDQTVRVACGVEKYSLSAHADSLEIASLIGQMSPSQGVVLVHGDEGARNSLATTIERFVGSGIYLPDNGQALEFRQGRKVFYNTPRKKTRNLRIGGPNQPLDASSLSHLHQTLWAESGRKSLYRLGDLYSRWYGPNQQATSDELDELATLLNGPQRYFSQDTRRPHLYRLNAPKKKRKQTSRLKPGVMEMNQARKHVSIVFPDFDEVGLYKVGARQEEQKLLLHFRFPKVAAELHEEAFEELREVTGWFVELNQMPHHAALDSHARKLLPEGWELARNPAIFHENQAVRLKVRQMDIDEDERDFLSAKVCDEYLNQTGYRLEIHFVRGQKGKSKSTKVTDSGRYEINQAYEHIEEVFAPLPHRPYKKSKKGEQIVVSFLSPTVGERYHSTLAAIAKETGWSIAINPEPNQYGIKQEAGAIFPSHWDIEGELGVLKQQALIRVRLLSAPGQDELDEVSEEIFERTGFHLVVAERDA